MVTVIYLRVPSVPEAHSIIFSRLRFWSKKYLSNLLIMLCGQFLLSRCIALLSKLEIMYMDIYIYIKRQNPYRHSLTKYIYFTNY